MNNKISIILPARKKDSYLDRAIESVLEQTFADWELIIVANGKLKNEKKYLSKLGNMPKIKVVFSEENVGAARNKGIEAATGDYVTFLDSDDYFERDGLYKLQLPLSTEGNCCKMIIIAGYTLHNFSKVRKILPKGEKLDRKGLHLFLLKNTAFGFPWGKLYSRDIFEGIRYPEDYIFEDIAVLPYMIDNSSETIIIDDNVYNYALKYDSLTYNISENGIIQGIEARINNYFFYTGNYPSLSLFAARQIIVQTAYGLSKSDIGYSDEFFDYAVYTIKRYLKPARMYYAYFFVLFPRFSGRILSMYAILKNGRPGVSVNDGL